MSLLGVAIRCDMDRLPAVLVAILFGCSVAAVTTFLQPYFTASSLPDIICDLILAPGQIIASLFHDLGTASPEFLWRSRIATVVLFGAAAYGILRSKKP